MKKIALEEAMIVPGQEDMVPDHKKHPEFMENFDRLIEVGPLRLSEMDKAQIQWSVLSLTSPGIEGLASIKNLESIARQWNDYMEEKINAYPDRFKGFACLPLAKPDLAIKELERISKKQAFTGCLINSFTNSGGTEPKYLDRPEYDDFWSAAQSLDMPIYIHPRGFPEARHKPAFGDIHELNGSTWGFHVDVAEHCLRLMVNGVFDRHPKLKIIIGHLGEIFSFWTWRIDHRMKKEQSLKSLKCERYISEYLKTNFFVTTSGYFDTPSLQHCIANIGIDRVMFSVDYLYEDCLESSQWLDSIPYSDEEKEKIAYKTAATLLKLDMGK